MPEYNFNFNELDGLDYDANVDIKTGRGTSEDPPAEPTNFVYPIDMMEQKTDHLLIRIFDQIRSTDIFDSTTVGQVSIPVPSNNNEQKRKNVRAVTEIKALPQFTDQFNNPDYEKKLKNNIRYIFLPIPQQVSDALSVGYAEDSLNPLQAAGLGLTKDLIEKPIKTVLGAKDFASGLVAPGGALSKVDKSSIDAIKAAASGAALNAFGANVSASSLIARASGQILQSNLELLFSNVTLRSFPFVYDFAPRNPPEAEVVKGIIRTLKKAMVPKSGKNAIFIKAPDVFQLQYKSGNKDHPFLNMFKLCVLSDLSVNYTASGTYATYGDATPVHIQVQMTFKEINPIYADDYDDLSERGYKNVGY